MQARLKRLIINPIAFLSIVQNDSCWRVFSGVEKDAELVGATLDPQNMNFILFVAHKSYPLINVQDEVAPLLTLEIRKVL